MSVSTVTYHVTKIAGGRDVYGHDTSWCDAAGCSGRERYLGAIASECDDSILGLIVQGLCDCGRGDTIEIDYDHSQYRGAVVGSRVVSS